MHEHLWTVITGITSTANLITRKLKMHPQSYSGRFSDAKAKNVECLAKRSTRTKFYRRSFCHRRNIPFTNWYTKFRHRYDLQKCIFYAIFQFYTYRLRSARVIPFGNSSFEWMPKKLCSLGSLLCFDVCLFDEVLVCLISVITWWQTINPVVNFF